MKKLCEFYPSKEEETCVCGCGSDISGSQNSDWICNEKFSKTCQWANERRKLNHREPIWYWRIWWWLGYHGLYQINWHFKRIAERRKK